MDKVEELLKRKLTPVESTLTAKTLFAICEAYDTEHTSIDEPIYDDIIGSMRERLDNFTHNINTIIAKLEEQKAHATKSQKS